MPALFPPVVRERLQDLASLARRATRSDGVAIAMQRQGEYVCCARSGDRAPQLGATVDHEVGFSAECIRTGVTLVCQDIETDPRVDAVVCRRLGIRSLAAVPLKSTPGIVGIVEAFSTQPKAFDNGATQILERLSQAIIAAVAHQYEATTERVPRDQNYQHQATPPALPSLYATETPREPPPAEPESLQRRLTNWTRTHKVLLVVALALISFGAFTAVRTVETHTPIEGAVPSPGNPADAIRTAAEQGDAAAQYRLAMEIQNGRVPSREPTEAFEWLQKAANLGNPDAQYELGKILAEGRGVPADPIAAYTWYTVSGISGNSAGEASARAMMPSLAPAQIAATRLNLGRMYVAGIAVPQDYVAAYSWLTLAGMAGARDAAAEKHNLASQMTRQQKDEASRRTASWLARHRPRASSVTVAAR